MSSVVLVRDALVAEVLADLVDALEPADDQSLQVELVGDPQEEVAVERVVVGHEGARERAAVERLEDRRLDLEEAALVEPAPDRPHDLGPQDEQLARLLVREQIDLPMPVSGLDVLDSVVLLRHRPQRLGQQRPVGDQQAQLAASSLEGGPVHPENVAEVERDEALERLLTQHVPLGVQLKLPVAVDEVYERGTALVAPCDHAPGDSVGAVGFLTRLEIVDDGRGGDHALELVRKGVDPLRAQALELRPPIIHAARGYSALDLGDLELARGAAGHVHAHRLAALVADERAADG
jgi:hypothetical protein